MQQVPVSTQNSGVPADTSNAKPDCGDVAPPRNAPYIEPVNGIVQPPVVPNRPIAVTPGSTAMGTTSHSQHNSLPPQILAPTTSDYVARPVNIPLGAANSLTGGKLKKIIKRKADPSFLIKREIINKAVIIKHMLRDWKPCADNSNELYWIGRSSLRNWQKMTTEVVMYCRDNIDNPNKMNKMSCGLNSDIVCPHANLTIDGKARILVPRELKEIVYSYYPGAPIFLKNTQPCITCQNEYNMTLKEINKQSAITRELKKIVKRKADPSLLSNGSNMQQVPVSTQNSGVPADTSNAKPDCGDVAPPRNAPYIEPVNGIVQPPVVPNRPIAVTPGSTAMGTTSHSQHNSLPPQILAPTTSDYVARPVNIPLGAANSLTGGKLKKIIKRKADPSFLIKREIINKAVIIKHMLRDWKPCADNSNELYWIGRSSLRNWQKMTTEVVMYCRDNIDNPNKMNKMSCGLNSDIVCPHANLTIDGKARILVPRELKEIVYSYYPGAPIFLKNTQPCITCQNEYNMTLKEINKQSAITRELKKIVKRKADPSLLSNGSNMQQVPVSTQNSGVPADTSNAKPDCGDVAPPRNAPYIEPVNGIVQPPVVPNRPIAVTPGSTAMGTTSHSQHNSLPPQILAPTTSDYVARPVNIPLGAANSLTGGKLKKIIKRKADPSFLIKREIINKAVIIKHMLRDWKPCADNSNELYWIGRSSLRNWQKMTTEVVMYCRDNIDNPNKMNKMSCGLNSDIVCPHANLTIDGKARILVPRELKEIVYSYYPGAPIFLKNTQPCITCQNEYNMTLKERNKQSAITRELKKIVKRKADPSLLSNGSNMQQVPVSTQNSGVPADTSNAKPDCGDVAPPRNAPYIEPVNGIVQPPVVPNRPIAVTPGSTAMGTTSHSQHNSLPPQVC